MHLVGEVEGRDCVLVDDMIDTAGTVVSAADLLMASPFMWNAEWLPQSPAIKAWFDRIRARPALQSAAAREAEAAARPETA